ncbi:FecR family protein [Sphingobacterium hotanense]|uniref:FecR family protein n=1 Tax=Sphingobacterium hotanense TaxID=649196 RepID=UPI0011F0E756|nr:FecR family protein [Sphingobacterium hotanense]
MDTTDSRLQDLLQLYLQNNLDLKDYEEFFALLAALPDEQLQALMQKHSDLQSDSINLDQFIKDRIDHLQNRIQQVISLGEESSTTNLDHKTQKIWKPWIGIAAACLLFAIGFSIYSGFWNSTEKLTEEVVMKKVDLSPGKDAAVMIIDGEEIVLNGEKSGVVLSDSSYSYLDGSDRTMLNAKEVQLVTPRGGQYQIVLTDGTKVWINADSRLTISKDFNIKNRTVQLSGEAFFEVKRNANLPFLIQSKAQDIRVLGTVFNVNTYSDEQYARTTLLSGSLKVNDLLLKPNQQALLNQENKVIRKLSVDAAAVAAWKDGIFDLSGLNFEECMRIIGRWYDLDIEYLGQIPQVDLVGKMSRGVKLSTFLDFLYQNTGVKGELLPNRKLIIK